MSDKVTFKNIIIFISIVILGLFVFCLLIGISAVLIHTFEILGENIFNKIDVFFGVK